MRASLRQFIDPTAPASTRWKAALLAAALATGAIRLADSSMSERNNRDYGTLIARQLASAAEGLVLAAQQKNIPNPAHWAITYLAQGVEPRLIQISKEQAGSEQLDTSRPGVVDYRKPLSLPGGDPESGIRILVTLPSAGFLGTTTPLKRDMATLAVVAVLTSLFGVLLSLRATRHARDSIEERQQRLGAILPELRDVLLGIGRQLKDLFSRFEELGSSSSEAQSNVARARATHHQGLRSVRKVIQAIDELNGHSLHVEASTLNVLVHSGRQDTASTVMSARLAHQQLVEMRQRQQKLQELLHELELRLEPLATDLDLSYHALQQSAQTLREVPAEIQRTGERMTAQARIFQAIRQELKAASNDA